MKKLRLAVLTASVLACPASVFAADLVLTNARVWDGTGSSVIENGTVVFEDGRILHVGAGEYADTSGVDVIDVGGRTVMPGLINAHFHLFFDFYSDKAYVGRSEADVAAFARDKLPAILSAHLENGFTTMVSAIDFWPTVLQVRTAVDEGKLRSPRLLVAGGVLMNPGGHYACRLIPEDERDWCDRHIALPVAESAAARAAVDALAESGVDMIMYDGLTNATGLKPDVVRAISEQADRHGLAVLVHNADARDAAAMVEAGVDGFLHPPGVTPDPTGELLRPVGAAGTPLAITLGRSERTIRRGLASDRQKQEYEVVRGNVLSLLDAGATPLFASDYPGIPASNVATMVTGVMKGVGLSNLQILHSATRDAARVLREPELGTIAPGQIGDVIIVDGDPIADLAALSKVTLVVKEGVIQYDNMTKAPTGE